MPQNRFTQFRPTPALVAICVLSMGAPLGFSAQCPGPEINSPEASQPSDTNWTAAASDAEKRQKFLACSPGQLAKVAASNFKLGPVAAQNKFNVALKAYLSKPGPSAKKLEVAAQAIHVQQLLLEDPTASRVLGQFGGAWERAWCESAHRPADKPLEAPPPPELTDEILAMSPLSLRVARELAADENPLSKTTCNAAVASWLSRASQ